jgi:hypothetical protein
LGGRLLAVATRLPHSSSSRLQSSLCVTTSMNTTLRRAQPARMLTSAPR